MSPWRVEWDNGSGHACGTFTQTFPTEEAAQDFGADWQLEMAAADPEGADEYTFEVIEVDDPADSEEWADEMGELRKAALNRGQP